MSLNLRSLALQGVGYGVLAVALQGFAPAVDVVAQSLGGGGGGKAAAVHAIEALDDESELRRQILEEDEIIILAVTQMIVNGAFG